MTSGIGQILGQFGFGKAKGIHAIEIIYFLVKQIN